MSHTISSEVDMAKPRALIITGYGVNCEAESAHAWKLAGAEPDMVHLNDMINEPARLREHDVLMFIGGFSYGDHMTSGHVFARRVKHHLRSELEDFIADGKLVLGVCNGFQVMVKMGLLPGLNGDYFAPRVALMQNDCGKFQNYWIDLKFEAESPCIFTRGLERMPLPIRHGEGKFFTTDSETLEEVEDSGCVACRYVDPQSGTPTQEFPRNPNGSQNAIAGLSDPSGRIFGLMPHPEAYLFPENHPAWEFQRMDKSIPEWGRGLEIFKNAVNFLV